MSNIDDINKNIETITPQIIRTIVIMKKSAIYAEGLKARLEK
jgi:hypothetical protein